MLINTTNPHLCTPFRDWKMLAQLSFWLETVSTHNTLPEEIGLYIVQHTPLWRNTVQCWLKSKTFASLCASCGHHLLPFHAQLLRKSFWGWSLVTFPEPLPKVSSFSLCCFSWRLMPLYKKCQGDRGHIPYLP